MKRRHGGIILGLVIALSTSQLAAVPIHRDDTPTDTPAAMIERLGDEDPSVRQAAEEQLLRLGAAARPVVVQASRSENPAIASRASQILLSLPFYRPTDPPLVRQILIDYGRGDEARRIETLTRLAEVGHDVAGPVLIRLLVEDPSEDVCWQIVTMLRATMDRGAVLQLRDVEPQDNRAAALTIVARAWYGRDRARALGYLRRAIDTESARPSYDGGELDFAFDRLADAAITAHRYEEAANLRRAQSARIGLMRDSYPLPVFELFAIHAQHGPLEGFASDLARFSTYTAEPQVLYSIGRAAERSGRAILARACADTASSVSFVPKQRIRVAQFLLQHGWSDLAERELELASNADDNAETAPTRAAAHWLLAQVAAARADDALAASHLQAVSDQTKSTGLQLILSSSTGRSVPVTPEMLRTRIALHAFRAARAARDETALGLQLERLVAIDQPGSEVVLEIVPYLRSIGRDADATRIFQSAYSAARASLDANQDDASSLNEVAWLCARSGERVAEAVELSNRAVELEPDTAAYLDTAAEASFRAGKIDEAIRLESRALNLEPDDKFMAEQLTRFRANRGN